MRSYLTRERPQPRKAGDPSLLVCVSDHPDSARLVRAGRRMADETRADWTVLYVETPGQAEISSEQQDVITRHMRLAELLGARTETLSGRSVAEAVCNYAQKNNIDQIMIGKSERKRWYSRLGMSLAEQIQHEDPTLNVFVVGSDQTPRPFQLPRFWTWMSHMQLLASLVLVALPTILGLVLTPTVISRSANVVMLYLVSVVIASIFLGLFPAILTTVLSVLVYDFLFIPPIYELFHFAPENTITFASLLVVSFIINTLVSRERALTRSAQRRADQVTHLYELSRDLASAVGMSDILDTIISHVKRTFEREAVILLPRRGELVLSASSAGKKLESGELTAAEWAFQQGRPAGHTTGTFSYASFRFFPLEASRGITGVLGVRLVGEKPDLHAEQVRLLSVYVTKAALAVERGMLAEEVSQTEILRVTEKLQTALLNSISHDLRTPLASITGVLSSLRMEEDFLDPATRQELVETAYGEAERLNRLVANLLDMTRLESGTIKISPQPCDIQDVIGSALNILSHQLEGHPVDIDIPGELPLADADYVLIQQVIVNLLENAAKYSPETGPITIRAQGKPDHLKVSVEDSGPGVAPEDLDRIFEKFYRVKRFENVVGTGLGLSICKGIVEVHGGKIWAENRPAGGLALKFTLPVWFSAMNEQEPEALKFPEEVET
jgi:two-component system sensor histidine kinase KdpD